jgi:hypothetical protein
MGIRAANYWEKELMRRSYYTTTLNVIMSFAMKNARISDRRHTSIMGKR